MNRKQLVSLLVFAIVIGAVTLIVYNRDASSWKQSTAPASGAKLLGDFPLNDVTAVKITTSGAQLDLVKKGDAWVVKQRDDYPANFDQISSLIRTLWDLKQGEDVDAGPSQFGRLDLNAPTKDGKDTATDLELDGQDGKQIVAIRLGKKYSREAGGMGGMGGFSEGRYVLPFNGSNRVYLVTETFDQAEPKPAQWLDRDFIHVDHIKSVALTGTTPAENWKLTRDSESASWQLDGAAPGEQIDTTKLPDFQMTLGSPSFADVMASGAKPADTGLDKPSTVVVNTFDGFTYTLKFGKAIGDNLALSVVVTGDFPKQRTPGKDEKPADKDRLDKDFEANTKKLQDRLATGKKFEQYVYLVPKSNYTSLFKDRAQLLAEKKPSPTPAPSQTASPSPSPVPSPSPLPSPSSSASLAPTKKPKHKASDKATP